MVKTRNDQLARKCLLSYRREEIRSMYRELRAIHQSLQSAKEIFYLLSGKTDVLGEQPVELEDLFDQLPDSTLLAKEDIPSFLNVFQRSIGDFLVSYQQLSNRKDRFKVIAEYVGHVDAYVSVAELMEHHLLKKNTFNWVKLISSEAVFKAKGLWNPMLDANQAVSNDISFVPNNNKLLLSGANASGKSVFASSIVTNAVLAQSFGIAASESLEINPFKTILTHIHFSDDINQNLSTMKAELKIIARILELATKSQDNMLIILDDSLFKGTTSLVGGR